MPLQNNRTLRPKEGDFNSWWNLFLLLVWRKWNIFF